MVGVVDVDVATYMQTCGPGWLAWSEGWQPIDAVLHSSYELLEPSSDCHNSALNVVLSILLSQLQYLLRQP